MKRRAYRAWVQTVVLTAAMAVFLLVSVAVFVADDSGARSNPFSVALYLVIGAGSLTGIWLALRMGAVVDAHGIRIRGFGRGMVIPWQEVAGVSCEVHDVRFGFPLYAPVVQMVARSGPPDVDCVPLTALASYRSTVAQRRTAALAAHVRSQPSRTDN